MDFGNRGGVFKTRFLRDSDQWFWARWYFTDPNAPTFGDFHAFGLPVWEGDFATEFDGPGCSMEGRERRNDTLDVPKTFRPVGLLDWYQNGLPALGAPLDTACGSPVINPLGGAVAGGTGFPDYRVIISLFCVCASPPALEDRDYHLIATACGCGSPSAPRYPRYHLVATACGCGSPSLATVRSRFLEASACGCGSPGAGLLPDYDLVASACGCGSPRSTIHAGPLVWLDDDFVAAFATPLVDHTPAVGGPWTAVRGTFSVLSGRCTVATYSGTFAQATAPLPGVDYTAEITFTLPDVFQPYQCGVMIRFQDANNYWLARINGNSFFSWAFQLVKVVGGVQSTVAQQFVSFTAGTIYTLTYKVSGNAHRVSWSGGSEVLTFTDGTFNSFSTCGVYSSSGGSPNSGLYLTSIHVTHP